MYEIFTPSNNILCVFHFRLTTFLVYLFSFFGMILYTLSIRMGYIEVVYVAAALLG